MPDGVELACFKVRIVRRENRVVAERFYMDRVDNTKREDIVFVGFSIWVLGMSTVAILNESPPHM